MIPPLNPLPPEDLQSKPDDWASLRLKELQERYKELEEKIAEHQIQVLVCGDRDWMDVDLIEHCLVGLIPEPLRYDNVLIHGDCRGADRCGAHAAKRINERLGRWIPITVDSMGSEGEKRQNVFEIKPYPADWKQYGKRAGPLRNQQMLQVLRSYSRGTKVVLAFHNDIERSRGTKDMVRKARSKSINTLIINSAGEVYADKLYRKEN